MGYTGKAATKRIFFRFEEDFAEGEIRCIPMIVRFKLDACGIKLKLTEWSRTVSAERRYLVSSPCERPDQVAQYRKDLIAIIFTRTGSCATDLRVEQNPIWARTDEIPLSVKEKLEEKSVRVSLLQWEALPALQRFALVKLSRPGHENRNFFRAIEEFGLS